MSRALAARLLPGVLGTIVALALFCALFPRYVYHWDEVQLTLGLEHFDPRAHQPHPPGYYLFIVGGRLLRPFVTAPEDALRAVAALAAAAFPAVVAARLPAALQLAPRLALVAAATLFVVGSPVVLFHSVAALTYTGEAASWLALLLAVGARPRGRLALALTGVSIGLAGGLRQTLIVWGLAVVALAWFLERSWLDARRALVLLAALAAGVLAWGVPMLVEAGGLEAYVVVSGPMLRGNIWEKSIFHEGTATIVSRLTRMPADLWLAAGPCLLLAAAALALRFHPRLAPRLRRFDLLPLGAALAFVFYLLLIYDSDGYILAVAFPLVAHALFVLAELACTWRGAARAARATPLLAALLFLWPGGLGAMGQRGFRAYAAHDARVGARLEAIARSYDPRSTLLVTSHEYWEWSFRHVMYYLPQYTTLQLLPDRFFAGAGPATPYLTGRAHRVRFSGPDGFDVRTLDPALTQVLYVIPGDVERFVTASCAPYMHPFGVTADELLPVIPLSEAEVRVSRSQLHCRRTP